MARGWLYQPCWRSDCDGDPVCVECELCEQHCRCDGPPAAPKPTTAPKPKPKLPTRENLYPGECEVCHGLVLARLGLIHRGVLGWECYHSDCARMVDPHHWGER